MALFISVFVTIFIVVDSIGLLPIFVALTQGLSQSQRTKIALRACLIATGLLVIFTLIGEALLNFIGIGLPAFRISGGILLFFTAFEMLFNKRSQRRGKITDDENYADPSVFPLSIPLIAGPGAMTTMILLTSEGNSSWYEIITILSAMFCVLIITYILFLFGSILERILGQMGINVITRLFGVLLAALSIQFIIDGLQELEAL